MTGWLYTMIQQILTIIKAIRATQEKDSLRLKQISDAQVEAKDELAQLKQTVEDQNKVTQDKLDHILFLLQPPPPDKMVMTITTVNDKGEEQMTKQAASGKMKLDILDNGHARATVTFLSDAGNPTQLGPNDPPPTYSASDPNAVTLSPAPDGLTCEIAPGGALAQGVIINADTTLANGKALHADNSTDPLNVVAGPAGQMVLQVAGA